MGEYATVRDKHVDGGVRTVAKLGTCDDWRYVRRDEVEAWHRSGLDAGQGTGPLAAILTEPSILYRFPYPDEDWQRGVAICSAWLEDRVANREMTCGKAVPLGYGEAATNVALCFDHDKVGAQLQSWQQPHSMRDNPCSAPRCKLDLPCPAHEAALDAPEESRVWVWNPRPCMYVAIVGERYDEHGPRTLFACGYCGAWFSLNEGDELAHVRACFGREYGERIHGRPAVVA